MNAQPSPDRLAQLAPARQRVWQFLSDTCLQPPDERTVDQATRLLRTDALDGLLSDDARTRLRDAAATMPDPAAADPLHTLRREFMDLFKVPGGRYLTPYESVYRDTREIAGKPVRGLLMGPSAIAVQKWYRLAALEISPDYKDLPDHIGLEFAYLAWLCHKEQQFASPADQPRRRRAWEMQRDFLANHVLAWLPALRDRVLDRARHPFYPLIAEFALAMAENDLATLEKVVGPAIRSPVPAYGTAPA